MIKFIIKDSIIYSLSNILTKGISFLMLPILTMFFKPEEFGVLDALIVTGNILSIIIGLEIHQAVARFFPEEKVFEEKRKIVSTGFWAIILFYCMFLLPIFIFDSTPVLNQLFNLKLDVSVIQIVLLSYGVNFIYSYSSSQLKWQLKTKENLFVSFVYSFISAIVTYILLKYSGVALISVFTGQLVGGVAASIISIYVARDYYGFIFEKKIFKKLLSFSFPLIFSTLTVYAMLYVDRVMIGSMLHANNLGYYAFAFRIASIIGLLTVGIQTALTPIIYNNFKNSSTPKYIAKMFHLFLIGSVIIVTSLVVFSDFIVILLASDSYLQAAGLIPWVALTILFTGMTNFTPGIFLEKKTNLILYINIASFLLNLLLGYILIKIFGLIGAVTATAICSVFYFSMYYIIGQKYYFIPFFWTKIKRSE